MMYWGAVRLCGARCGRGLLRTVLIICGVVRYPCPDNPLLSNILSITYVNVMNNKARNIKVSLQYIGPYMCIHNYCTSIVSNLMAYAMCDANQSDE